MAQSRPETGSTRGTHPFDAILEPFTIAAGVLYADVVAGRTTAEQFMQEMRASMNRAYAEVLRKERAVMAAADHEMGMETLTTDTAGGHPLSWFADTGRVFATGTPTSGIAVAVIHPDIGMGGAHRNFIGVEDVLATIYTAVSSPLAQRTIETVGSDQLSRMTASNESLQKTAGLATTQALDAVAALAGDGIPQNGTQIMVAGGDFLSPAQIPSVAQAIASAVQTHPSMHDGRQKYTGGRNIGLRSQLGQPLGILWGGPRHADYANPAFYQKG